MEQIDRKSVTEIKKEVKKVTASGDSVIASSDKIGAPVENFEQIDAEMEKADALLKKVQKVRCDVNDSEVQKMCNIEKSDRNGTSVKPLIQKVSKTDKVEMEICSKPPYKGGVQNKSVTRPKTTYTSSYKTPGTGVTHRKTRPKATQSDDNKSNAMRNERKLRDNSPTGIFAEAQNINLRNNGLGNQNRHLGDQVSTEIDADTQMQAFSLYNDGRNMKVPRCLKTASCLNRQLKSKLRSCNNRTTPLSQRLSAYYISLEQGKS
ncbi:uncharacterized protein [Watersipora subatra]|uniref:uncharacterized protein isoform X2 n=1 Tax=Watersipora subatra TaxID=2589382 RepID=UPI00355B77D0